MGKRKPRGKKAQLKAQIKEYEEALIQLEKERNKYKEYYDEGAILINIPPIAPIPSDFQRFHYNIISLTTPHYFDDRPEYEFEKIVLVTRRPYEKEFHFASQVILVDNGTVKGNTAGAWIVRIAYTPDDIPILYSCYTEKDTEEFYLPSILKAQDIINIKIEVLELMYRHLVESFARFKNKIKTAEYMESSATNELNQLQKKIEHTGLMNRPGTMEELSRASNRIKLKIWQFILAISGWGFAVILAAIAIGIGMKNA